jgi:parvulin-like peptidyl-prolyl isomerase
MKKRNATMLTAGAVSAVFLLSQSVFAQDVKPVAAPADAKPAVAAPAAVAPAPAKEDLWGFLPDTVAEINGKKVTKEDFIKSFMAQFPDGQIPPMVNRQMLEKIAPQVVQQMVERMGLLTVAEKAGFKADKQNVINLFNDMVKKMPPEQLEMLKQNMAQQNSNIDAYIAKTADNKFIQENVAIDEWLKKTVTNNIKATPEDLKAYYEKNKENFKAPADAEGSVRASHILIKFKDDKPESDAEAKAQAEKILARIKAGESFEKLAESESACPSGKMAKGALGCFSKGQMVPEFEKVTFELKPGEISGVVKTQFGYHIIRRDKSMPAVEKSFEEVKGAIENMIVSERTQAAIKELIEKVKAEQNIKIFVAAAPKPEVKPVAKPELKK